MTAALQTVLVANRGEIAVRVIRTLKRMGIASVAVYTDADRHALHVRRADNAIRLGSPLGYLDRDAIVAAALRAGADAVHPGYGFLAENASFASACGAAGVVFIGPPPAAIEVMGDKINAKVTVAAAGVPVVPGRDQAGLDDAELEEAARAVGLPVLLKPSAGGGGKGMRLVTRLDELGGAIEGARREALRAFGDDTILVERFVTNPRHIEMQIFADTHGNVAGLGERECSLQRRHQKIVEEAPSPLLDEATRAAMSSSAVEAARACGYVGAGTVEFIVSADDPSSYYFMEMNTRLQVEHPVTEMVLGVDLVEWQIRVAQGEAIPWTDPESTPRPKGHAVEARIYAEDPGHGFLPATGRVHVLRQPRGRRSHVRVDSALYEGVEVGTGYDPMLAKVIGWGETRGEALDVLGRALHDTAVLGVRTNLDFLGRLIERAEVREGRIDTGLVERIASELVPGPVPDEAVAAIAVAHRAVNTPDTPGDAWSVPDGWRVGGPAPTTTTWRAPDGRRLEVALHPCEAIVDGRPPLAVAGRTEGSHLVVECDGVTRTWLWATDGDTFWVAGSGESFELTLERPTLDRNGPGGNTGGRVTSPMPGTVLTVDVADGQRIEAGQRIAVVEAMKMEHAVIAPSGGVVTAVLVKPGDLVKLDQPLATIGTDPETDGSPLVETRSQQ